MSVRPVSFRPYTSHHLTKDDWHEIASELIRKIGPCPSKVLTSRSPKLEEAESTALDATLALEAIFALSVRISGEVEGVERASALSDKQLRLRQPSRRVIHATHDLGSHAKDV